MACRRQDRLVWQAIRQVVLQEASQLDVPQSEAQQLLAQVGRDMKLCTSSIVQWISSRLCILHQRQLRL